MGQFQKGIRPDMDKNVIRRGEIVSDSGKLYSVIGVLGTVMYIQETDAGNKKVNYQLKEIEPLVLCQDLVQVKMRFSPS